MTGTDFGMGFIAKLAMVGICAIILALLASPFLTYYLWQHLAISWK